jgi:hypothetical protein
MVRLFFAESGSRFLYPARRGKAQVFFQDGGSLFHHAGKQNRLHDGKAMEIRQRAQYSLPL